MPTDLRARLLDAAIAIMAEGADPTLRAVARRAGVSPMAPYRHFADRAALVDAAAVSGLYVLKAALRPAAGSDRAAVLAGIVRFAIARPAMARVLAATPAGRAGLAEVVAPVATPDRAGQTVLEALALGLIHLVLAGEGDRALAAIGAGQGRAAGAGGGHA